MEEKVIARIIPSQSGLTFDKTLIDQSLSQNYVNGFNLYNKNVRSIPNNTQNLTKIILLLEDLRVLIRIH